MSHPVSTSDCFDGLIALRGTCDDAVSVYSLWINELGIDAEFIEQVITKDYKSPQDFFDRKKRWAIQNVVSQIHNHTRPKYKTATVVDQMKVGFYADNLAYIAGDGSLKGINVNLCNSNSSLDFFLNKICLQINQTVTVSVEVYDLLQDKLLDTIDVDCVAGEISCAFPNKTYPTNRNRLDLFIGYDSTGISGNKTTLSECVNCNGHSYSRLNNNYETISAAKIGVADQKVHQNLDQSSDTGGLSIVHSLSCNHESWLCSISNQLGMPVLYKTAAMIYDHALSAAQDNRVNTAVTMNQDILKERFEKMEFLYAQSMDNLIQNVKPPHDEICFVCRDNVRHAVVLP